MDFRPFVELFFVRIDDVVAGRLGRFVSRVSFRL